MSGSDRRARPDRENLEGIALTLVILRCQAGDELAFERLVDAFAGRIRRYLGALVGDDADDVQQVVWVSVYRNLRDLANPGAFRSWLFRLARNRAIDHLRRLRRERELFTDIEEGIDAPAGATDDDDRLDPATLTAAIEALPPPQREVVLLRFRDELSYEEIAQIVGCPLGTVRTRLHHAKKKLTQSLTGETI